MQALTKRVGAAVAATAIVFGVTALSTPAQAAPTAPVAATAATTTVPSPEFGSLLFGPHAAAVGKGVPGAIVTLDYQTRFGPATTSTTVDDHGYWWADLEFGFTQANEDSITLVQTVDGTTSAAVAAVR